MSDIWKKLSKTDPQHTSRFKRPGGFSGTAIKPIWAIKRMTEQFGDCGTGWGINPPSFHVEDCQVEKAVYCTVTVWYQQQNQVVVGVGGDKIITESKYGKRVDDEAFKKAYTDAVMNALKYLGVGADVHMGQFDDSKYVQEVQQEFHPSEDSKATTPKGKIDTTLFRVCKIGKKDVGIADAVVEWASDGRYSTYSDATKDDSTCCDLLEDFKHKRDEEGIPIAEWVNKATVQQERQSMDSAFRETVGK